MPKIVHHPQLPHESCKQHERQSHDGKKIALDALDDRRTIPLNSVRAGLVHGLAGGDVAVDLRFTHASESHVHGFDSGSHVGAVGHAYGGKHLVYAPLQRQQHVVRVVAVPWFRQDSVVGHDDRIRSNDERVGLIGRDPLCLGPGQALDAGDGILAQQRRLVYVRRSDGMSNADQIEQISPPRRL